MHRFTRRGLLGLFTAAAIGACGSSAALGQTPNSDDSVLGDLAQYNVSFREFGTHASPATVISKAASPVIVAHIEMDQEKHFTPNVDTMDSYTRHGKAAAAILREAAEDSTDRQVLAYDLDIDPVFPSPPLLEALQHINIVSQSTDPLILPHNAFDAQSVEFDPVRDKAIIAMAAGNNGDCMSGGRNSFAMSYELHNKASVTMLSPYFLNIGRVDDNGDLVSYSHGTFPDMDDNAPSAFGYRLHLTPKEFRHHMAEMTGVTSDAEINNATKEYTAYLSRQEIKAGTLEYYFPGTSFSAPENAGHLAGGYRRYPDLSPMEKWVAAITSATPVARQACVGGLFITLPYKQNPRGLPYNESDTGFGRFNYDAYLHNLETIRQLKTSLKQETVPLKAEAYGTVGEKNGQKTVNFSIPDNFTVTRIYVIVKTAAGAPQNPSKNPKYPTGLYTLTDPLGYQMSSIAGLQYVDKDDLFPAERMVTTAYFSGEQAKGTWRLALPPPSATPPGYVSLDLPVEKAKIVIYGFRGALDAYFNKRFVPSWLMRPASQPPLRQAALQNTPR